MPRPVLSLLMPMLRAVLSFTQTDPGMQSLYFSTILNPSMLKTAVSQVMMQNVIVLPVLSSAVYMVPIEPGSPLVYPIFPVHGSSESLDMNLVLSVPVRSVLR